jgi:hypothetical protein
MLYGSVQMTHSKKCFHNVLTSRMTT